MAVGILILLFIAAVFMPKSKLLHGIMLIYMWLLFSLNTGAPDTATYEWIYNNNIPGAFEPIFTALMAVCRLFHLPFLGFRMLIATLLLVFVNLAFRNIEQYKTLALAMYMIAPFPWQVSGMRAALACAILMYGISILIEDPKKNVKKFCIVLLIATLVHYSSILFVVLLLAGKKASKNKIIVFAGIAIIGTIIVQHSDILFNVVSQFTSREKIITWLSGGPGKEGYPNWKGFTAELLILFGNIVLTLKSKVIVARHDLTGEKTKIATVISNLNIATILFIPFLRLNDTYVRLLLVMHSVNIILYIMAAFCLQEHDEIDHKRLGGWIVSPKTRFSIYTLVIPIWTYFIAFYQTLPYLGTPQSVFEFLEQNIIF